MSAGLGQGDLVALDAAVERALESGDAGGLRILGYGEISTVVAWTGEDGAAWACKRLPVFPTPEALEEYRRGSAEYLAALAELGVEVVPTGIESLEREGGGRAVYCVQPLLPGDTLATKELARMEEAAGRELFSRMLDLFGRALNGRVGIDGQLSNWCLAEGRLLYLDVSTPMLRRPDGTETLDADVFLASLPWALRGAVKRWLLRSILDKYYQFRGVVLDFLGNLIKERLERWIPPFLDLANARLEARPLSLPEIRAYYRDDARMWALLQRLRRMDRFWRRRIRRQVYPFLLPGNIER